MTQRVVCGLAVAAVLASAAAAQDEKRATIKVKVPRDDATLTIDGEATAMKGLNRVYQTPELEPGKKYGYNLVVSWMPNNYETFTIAKQVAFKAGDTVEVDLTLADERNKERLKIRYVPTPPDVVEAMVKLAGVGKDDVVYDLGCGDGRMVIAAVKAGAKRGVGIDLDPERLKECKDNAKEAKVEDKVEFRMGDVLDVKDMSDATVVLLYMSDAMNLKLRPILEKSLKPGSRIVSHRFTMGDWQPAKTETITRGDGDRYLIHLWKIPEKK